MRYPGGKGKISRFVVAVLDATGIDGTYIEPFAGGAGVAVNLLLADVVGHILINDLDQGIYSFWKTVTMESDWLIQKIQEVPFDYTVEHHPNPEKYMVY